MRTAAKQSVLWLYSWGLLSVRVAQALIDRFGLRLA